MNTQNIILFTDSYKVGGHWQQYPKNITNVFSYIEPRGCDYTDEVVAFGIQYFIKKYLSKPITLEDIEEAELVLKAHGVNFNKEGWLYILNAHKGMLPVRIKTLPEGSVVKIKNVMLTIESTDPKCYWLVSYLETAILQNFWYGCTVASNAFYCKKMIHKALVESSDNPEVELPFKLHCFGFRGVSSLESAGIGNAAFLTSFSGTDTIAGILTAMKYYDSEVCGFSIAASEHSTMTSWTKNGERQAYQNMIEQYAQPGKIFACVIDSYDTFNAIDIWCDGLLDQVKAQGATVVLRPDSGNPVTMPIDVIKYLMDKVGYKINSKGYKVLPDHIRVIQGDGITLKTIPLIIENLLKNNLSMSNLAMGMGAGTLQKVCRDDFKWAMKCSSITIGESQYVDVFKDPVTDSGKQSKKGRLTLYKDNLSKIYTALEGCDDDNSHEILETVYENKPLASKFQSFTQIRERINKNLEYDI